MPKLSANSREKKFPCQYCGESVRTRQGLSGHIQWKHDKKNLKTSHVTSASELAVKLPYIVATQALSDLTLDEAKDMALYWGVVGLLFTIFEIELTQGDLKNYLITSLVQIHQNRRLRDQLIDSLQHQ